jgi:hypothetical protein
VHRRQILAITSAIVALTTLALGSPAQAADNPPGSTTLVLFSGVPTTSVIPSPNGTPVGTVRFFESIVQSTSGKAVGRFHASVTTVDMSPADVVETRMRNVVFSLAGGQIVASGIGLYPNTEMVLAAEVPAHIAIVGGTGKFIGARGEVTTIRRPDGTYRHVLTLLK